MRPPRGNDRDRITTRLRSGRVHTHLSRCCVACQATFSAKYCELAFCGRGSHPKEILNDLRRAPLLRPERPQPAHQSSERCTSRSRPTSSRCADHSAEIRCTPWASACEAGLVYVSRAPCPALGLFIAAFAFTKRTAAVRLPCIRMLLFQGVRAGALQSALHSTKRRWA